MGQFFPAAVLNQQMPPDQIRETRTVFDAIMSGDGAPWGKFSASEEIAHLLKRERRTAGQYSSGEQPRRRDRSIQKSSRAFQAKKDFCRLFVVMDAEVERALTSNSDFLCDVITTSGKSATIVRRLSYIGHVFCNSLEVLATHRTLQNHHRIVFLQIRLSFDCFHNSGPHRGVIHSF